MTAYNKVLLSGSTNGKGIKVVAVATPGTTIHTAAAGTTGVDEVWLWVINMDILDRVLTLEWGGVGVPDDNIAQIIPPKAGLVLIAPGLTMQNGLVIKAFAAAANMLCIHGFVNRITL